MKTTFIYFLLLTLFVQCRKESDDCHFFVTIQNNSNNEILFSEIGVLLDISNCSINDNPIRISSKSNFKYRPYPHPDCIKNALKIDVELLPLYIIDPNNYTTDIVPCEEFEVQNTILRTYILTLEDLERMNYTINYPEDASIGVE